MKTKINLRIFPVLFIFAACAILAAACPLYAQDKIVAIVNRDAITQKDVSEFLNFMRLQLSKENKGKDLEEKLQGLKVAVLSRLIEDRLILQEAKNNNITVDENRIKQKIGEIKKDYPSDTQFQAELIKQGLTQGDIEKKVREQFMMFTIVEEKVRSKVIIKPEEVTEFYEKNKQEINSGETKEFDVLSADSYALARNAARELRAGKEIADLAAKYHLIINTLNVSRGNELRGEIMSAISGLNPGEVSDPVEIDEKYYTFRLKAVIPAKELSLTEAQARIHSLLFEKKMQEGLNRWLDELRKNSYIKIMPD